jgi:hypothetical protein
MSVTAESRAAVLERWRQDDIDSQRIYLAFRATFQLVGWDMGRPYANASAASHIELALRDLAWGLADGYPPCCVEEYVMDTLDDRLSGVRRGSVPDADGGVYVPCSECCRAMGREIIP